MVLRNFEMVFEVHGKFKKYTFPLYFGFIDLSFLLFCRSLMNQREIQGSKKGIGYSSFLYCSIVFCMNTVFKQIARPG